jgi:hypothetical protein
LPFADSAVVGDTYYATPVSGGPLRLRIDFSPTQWANEGPSSKIARWWIMVVWYVVMNSPTKSGSYSLHSYRGPKRDDREWRTAG